MGKKAIITIIGLVVALGSFFAKDVYVGQLEGKISAQSRELDQFEIQIKDVEKGEKDASFVAPADPGGGKKWVDDRESLLNYSIDTVRKLVDTFDNKLGFEKEMAVSNGNAIAVYEEIDKLGKVQNLEDQNAQLAKLREILQKSQNAIDASAVLVKYHAPDAIKAEEEKLKIGRWIGNIFTVLGIFVAAAAQTMD